MSRWPKETSRDEHNNRDIAGFGIGLQGTADLVICNGGSGARSQALSHGVPVLGWAANLDRMSVMAPFENHTA
jgi:hypothetical protein